MALPVFAKELQVNTGYGTIACKVWGHYGAKEKFLAYHGFLDNAGTFDPLVKQLLNRDRCIVCVEFPGHGLSCHLPKGIAYSPAIDLQAMKSVMKHLGWTSAIFMGHSMGAARSQLYALCWPQEVKALITLDGASLPLETDGTVDRKGDGPYDTFAKQLDNSFRVAKDYYGKSPEYELDDLIDMWYAAAPQLTRDEVINIQMKRGTTKLANGNYKLNRDPALRGRTNMILQFPVELMMEEHKKRHGDTAHLLLLAGNLNKVKETDPLSRLLDPEVHPKTTLYKIIRVDGSHHFHVQMSEEVGKMIEDFLAELAAF